MSAPDVSQAKPDPGKGYGKHFVIRLRNRLNVSAGVPSQWLSVYLVHRGKVVQAFPFELSELAEGRALEFEYESRTRELAESVNRSRFGVHVYLANARRGEVDTHSLDNGVFLGRFAQMPTGVELDAGAMVQLFLGRLAKLRDTQPAASGLLAEREFEAIVRPVDPEFRVARSLAEIRHGQTLLSANPQTARARVVFEK